MDPAGLDLSIAAQTRSELLKLIEKCSHSLRPAHTRSPLRHKTVPCVKHPRYLPTPAHTCPHLRTTAHTFAHLPHTCALQYQTARVHSGSRRAEENPSSLRIHPSHRGAIRAPRSSQFGVTFAMSCQAAPPTGTERHPAGASIIKGSLSCKGGSEAGVLTKGQQPSTLVSRGEMVFEGLRPS